MAISAEVRAVYNAYVRLAEEATDPNEQEKFYQLAYDSIQEGFVPPVENSPVPPQVAAAAAPPVRESTDELRRRLGLIPLGSDIGRQEDEPGLETPDKDWRPDFASKEVEDYFKLLNSPDGLQKINAIIKEGEDVSRLKMAGKGILGFLSIAKGGIPPSMGLTDDMKKITAGNKMERMHSYITKYNQDMNLQRANTFDSETMVAAPDVFTKLATSVDSDPVTVTPNLNTSIAGLMSQTNPYGDPFNAVNINPNSGLLNKLNAEYIATPPSTPLDYELALEDQIIQRIQNESKRVRDINAGLKSVDAEKANKAAGYLTHPDTEERYQEPSFTPSPSERGDIFGGFSGGGLL